MSIEIILLMSQIIDKLEIKEELKNIDPSISDEELGKEIIILLATKIYKAKNEVYNFIIEYKNIYPEKGNLTEDQYKKEQIKLAKNYNIMDIIKELKNIEGIKDFLALVQP